MKYFFLNSYFNALEKHLADEIDFNRMINSENEDKAYQVLQDTNYAKWALANEPIDKVFEQEKIFFSRDLDKMGFTCLAGLFCLKADITNLRIFLKKKIFGFDSGDLLLWGKNEQELEQEFEKEIQESGKLKNALELDDYLTKVYLDRLEYQTKKDKSIQKFIKEYRQINSTLSGEEKHQAIKKMEDDFIAEHTKQNEGLSPILAFFMKKSKIEKKIKTIISGKQINFTPSKIKEMIENLQTL